MQKISTGFAFSIITLLAVFFGGIFWLSSRSQMIVDYWPPEERNRTVKNEVKPIEIVTRQDYLTKLEDAQKIILSDTDLLQYAQSPFDNEKMMNKSFYLGSHNGTVVKTDFPCGDICPDYTMRIISYIVDIARCETVGGVTQDIITDPQAGPNLVTKFCIPKIIAENDVNENGDSTRMPELTAEEDAKLRIWPGADWQWHTVNSYGFEVKAPKGYISRSGNTSTGEPDFFITNLEKDTPCDTYKEYAFSVRYEPNTGIFPEKWFQNRTKMNASGNSNGGKITKTSLLGSVAYKEQSYAGTCRGEEKFVTIYTLFVPENAGKNYDIYTFRLENENSVGETILSTIKDITYY